MNKLATKTQVDHQSTTGFIPALHICNDTFSMASTAIGGASSDALRVAPQKPSRYRRFREQSSINLPKCSTRFTDFAFKKGYKDFVMKVQNANNNQAPRAKVEFAWKQTIHNKYALWNPKGQNPAQKVDKRIQALKQMKGSKAWRKKDIEAHWQGITARIKDASKKSALENNGDVQQREKDGEAAGDSDPDRHDADKEGTVGTTRHMTEEEVRGYQPTASQITIDRSQYDDGFRDSEAVPGQSTNNEMNPDQSTMQSIETDDLTDYEIYEVQEEEERAAAKRLRENRMHVDGSSINPVDLTMDSDDEEDSKREENWSTPTLSRESGLFNRSSANTRQMSNNYRDEDGGSETSDNYMVAYLNSSLRSMLPQGGYFQGGATSSHATDIIQGCRGSPSVHEYEDEGEDERYLEDQTEAVDFRTSPDLRDIEGGGYESEDDGEDRNEANYDEEDDFDEDGNP